MNSKQGNRLLLLSLPAPYAPDTPLFPLGIGYLSAALQPDRPVQALHYRCFEEAQQQLPAFIADYAPTFVGLTCSTFNRGAVKRVCQWLHAAHPEIRIIVGGVHASFMYEQVLRSYGAHCVVIGEGETTLRELCAAYDARIPLHTVQGIAFLEGEQVIITPRREPIADLDELPVPDYSFAADLIRQTGTGFLIGSRGCPVQCSFCSTSSYWGQKVRMNSPKRVVDEMEQLVRAYGVQKIFFHDDTFNLGLGRVREICSQILSRNLKVEWGASCRVTPVSEEMLKLMVEAGCRHICWGIESGSEKILTSINKHISREQIRHAFELCRPHMDTLSVGAFVMVGNPGETEETINETVAFLNTLPMTDSPSSSLLYILPGTALYQQLPPEITPILERHWADADDVPFYTLENPVENLLVWHERIIAGGQRLPYDRHCHFWNGVLFQQPSAPPSELDQIIPPEIKDDELYALITELARKPDIKTVLEIGSSAGGGSTEAFVTGLKMNPEKPKLFCMEVSQPRYMALKERYKNESFVLCHNASSVPVSSFPSEREVEIFYRFIPTALNNYPLERVIGWLHQDIDYIKQTAAPQNGIEIIKKTHGIKTFDIVLIDGSEFLGKAELDAVYGAGIIILDDVNGFKNYHNRLRLLNDSTYELLHENLALRNGYSVFRRKNSQELPVHFFTIVLNGEPFIRHHIEAFSTLPFRWHWHIVEGVAELVHDTAWSLPSGGRIPEEFHRNGLSNDGTSAYLDELAARFPDQVTLYRKPDGTFWNGKLEMVNAPLANIREECLLWQVDSDELWETTQIATMHTMFAAQPGKTAAFFCCHFYVGQDLVTTTVNTYGNNTSYEWLRCWRYEPGDQWKAHEPPALMRPERDTPDHFIDVGHLKPFLHSETIAAGLVFRHYAYALESQVAFKEKYYGYNGALNNWKTLQNQSDMPVMLRDFFPWVHDETQVNRLSVIHTSEIKKLLYLRTDAIGDNVLSTGMLPLLRKQYPGAVITIVCQDRTASLYEVCPDVDSVISFNVVSLFTNPAYRIMVIDKINMTRPDLLLNPIYSHELHDEFLAHHIEAPLKICIEGDSSNRSSEKLSEMRHLYTTVIPNNPDDITELEHNRTFLQGIGIHTDSLHPQVWISNADRQWAGATLQRLDIAPATAIILFPGALLDCKTYPHYGQVVAKLADVPVLICGGEEQREQGEKLCHAHGGKAINLAGQTSLGQLAALMQHARLYLGSDSSGLHIACAVGLKNVVLLGGGHFGRFCPYSPLTTAVSLPLACYGCNWRCPHDRIHCLHDITPDTVLTAVRSTLDTNKSGAGPMLAIQTHAATPASIRRLTAEEILQHAPQAHIQHSCTVTADV